MSVRFSDASRAIYDAGGEPEQRLAAAVIKRAILDITDNGPTKDRVDALRFFDSKRCYGWFLAAFPTRDPKAMQRMTWEHLFTHAERHMK